MKGVVRIAVFLTAFLIVVVGMMLLGRTQGSAFDTSANSYNPSGLRAFVTLLGQSGYQVVVDGSAAPKVRSTDLVIAIKGANNWFRPSTSLDEALKDHVREGGVALIGGIQRSSFEGSYQGIGAPVDLLSVDRKPTGLKVNSGVGASLPAFDEQTQPVFLVANTHFVGLAKFGTGRYLQLDDAVVITNRYVDRYDNARAVLGPLKRLHPTGRIVILDGYSGRISEKGLLASIGPWMQYGWWQVLVLFLVFAYLSGKRLGLPEFDKPIQVGQRELVDAVGAFWRRGKATNIAMRLLIDHADHQIRQHLKLSIDTPKDIRDRQIPDSLRILMERAERLSIEPVPFDVVVPIARSLDREVREFTGSRKRRRSTSRIIR